MTAVTACTAAPGSPEWLAERRNGIGASEMAVILTDEDGAPINPFASPHALWEEKTGRAEGFQGNYPSRRGQHMESFVIAEFAAQNPGYIVETPPDDLPSILAHPDYPIVRCSLDALAHSKAESIVVEAKAITRRQASEWDHGEVPDYYLVQVQAQMLVTGLENARIVVDVAGTYEERFIPRNDQFCAHLLEKATQWWQSHIVEDIEPEWNYASKADRRHIANWPPSEASKVADPVVIDADLAEQLRAAKQAKKDAETAFAYAAAAVQDQLKTAGAEEGLDPFGNRVATWRGRKGATTIDREALKRDGLFDKYSLTGEPGRQFLVSP